MILKWLKKFIPQRKHILQNNKHGALRKYLINPNLWHFNHLSVAGGFAAGLFAAFIPMPLQIPIAILLAIILRGNLIVAITTTFISNPLTFVPISYFIYRVGNLALSSQDTDFTVPVIHIHFDTLSGFLASTTDALTKFGKAYAVGLPIVSISAAILGYTTVLLCWHTYQFLRSFNQPETVSKINQLAPHTAWHAESITTCMLQLKTNINGLMLQEAANRLITCGVNTLPSVKRRSIFSRFLSQFNHILIFVLLGAAIISALLHRWSDMGVIVGVILINALVGIIQEGKAEHAIDMIRHMLSLKATVLRDNQRHQIPAENLVPGDVVLLKSGDKVPADLRLVDTKNLQIQEAILTGESLPVDKSSERVPVNTELAERTCMAYSGTMVNYGQGIGIVIATGIHTQVGQIGMMLSDVIKLKTPLLKRINQFSQWLTFIILCTASITFIIGVFIRGYQVNDMLMAAIGISVAAIPEGLPTLITVVLALGVMRMAAQQVIVRILPAIETLGCVTVICTDKTGTLTRNELCVKQITTAQHTYLVTGDEVGDQGNFLLNKKIIQVNTHEDLLQVILAALLCNDAELIQRNGIWQLHGNPVDGALLCLGLKAGLDPGTVKKTYPLADLIPFQSEHKYMASKHQKHQGHSTIYVKGAPENILNMCKSQIVSGQCESLNYDYWAQQIESLASIGQRVIAIAMQHTTANNNKLHVKDFENQLCMIALFGIFDPPRNDAISSIQACYSAGITVKMITGDHVATARHVAQLLGIHNSQTVVTGYELDQLDAKQFNDTIKHVNVFARTSPQHKLMLVESLQANNHIVAMTGDGVNDAPALKRADIGIAMGHEGSEAAKEAAEIVLMDNKFSSIISAVKEGRTVYDNIWKAIVFVLPTDCGEALLIVIAILFGLTLPITPLQILWVNTITAVTLGLALAFEPPEHGIMNRPPYSQQARILSGPLIFRTVYVSIAILAGSFLLFYWSIANHDGLQTARTITVNTLVMSEIAYLLNSLKLFASSMKIDVLLASKWVLSAIFIAILLQMLLTYTPWMQRLFQTAPLNLTQWCYILLYGIALFLFVELEKYIGRCFRCN